VLKRILSVKEICMKTLIGFGFVLSSIVGISVPVFAQTSDQNSGMNSQA
jgi:hypothetical protein